MKLYSLIAITFLVLVLFTIIPVSAETLTGTLGANEIKSSTYFMPTWVAPDNAQMRLYSRDIENTAKAFSVVRFMNASLDSFAVGAPPSAWVPCNFSIGGTQIGTGSIGYQRTYNIAVPPVETPQGFEYVLFNSDWNITGRSGNILITINYNDTQLYTCRPAVAANPTIMPSSWLGLGGTQAATTTFYAAPMTWNQDTTIWSTYTATQPSGLGIQGSVVKTVGGTNYPSRIFIVDGTTGATISADSTTNGNNYNFTVLSRQSGIKIAMYNAATTSWSNSSTLFAGATPTPTNTPTPGPTTMAPGTYSNLTFTTRYGMNSTVIPNVFVKLYMYHENGPMGDDDWSQAVDGYTDSNGQIVFQQVSLPGWDFRVEFTKPGLYQVDFWLEPTQYAWGQTYYMYVQPTNSEIPGIPNQVNVTLQVKNAVTFQPVSAAWVTIGDDISGTNYVGQSTNATGYVYFPGIPNTANINGQITKVGYTPLTYWVTSGSLLEGDTALTKYIYLTSVVVTPTITPVLQEGVTLTASPNSVAPGQSTTLTMTCANVTACTGAGGMHVVTYSEKYPDPSWDTHTIAIFHYNTSTNKYDYRPNADVPWQYGTWTGLVATGTPTISGINTYYVNAMRDDYYSIGQANVGVLVTGAVAGNLNMKLASQDQTTGGHLYNYQMNLTNRNTGAITEFNTVVYEVNKLLPRGQDYTVQCSKSGYLPGSQNFQVPTDPNIVDGTMGTFVNCPLYPTGSISAGNTTVTVKVFDAENYLPLPNVQVQMSAPVIYSDSPKYTGGDGAGVFFVLGQNQPYSVTASKTGYCAVTETGNTSTLDTKNVYLNLKYGSCMGPTPTHTPTPGPTGTTPGVIVTPTTFQPGNATTFWRPWINVFTSMGANTGEINMLLAGLIIVLLMAVGGGVAGVLGAEVFMGFGAIFCVAVGLIPIWVVLAIITLGFLFYGLKIGR